MLPLTREWLEGLKTFAAAATPPATASPATAAERTIVAAALVSWLDTSLADVQAARPQASGFDPDPALVITTSGAGFDAVADVLGRHDPAMAHLRDRVACVDEKHYRLWCMRHPDPEHRLHVNHWNWVKVRLPEQRRTALASFPLAAGESYWLHRTGTAGAGPERRSCQLWKWNGRTASLLAPFVDESVAGLAREAR